MNTKVLLTFKRYNTQYDMMWSTNSSNKPHALVPKMAAASHKIVINPLVHWISFIKLYSKQYKLWNSYQVRIKSMNCVRVTFSQCDNFSIVEVHFLCTWHPGTSINLKSRSWFVKKDLLMPCIYMNKSFYSNFIQTMLLHSWKCTGFNNSR